MKSSDIVNEGIWDDMKSGYKAGKDDYIKRQYAQMQADKKAQRAAGKAAPAPAAAPAGAPAAPVKASRNRKPAATTAAPTVTVQP